MGESYYNIFLDILTDIFESDSPVLEPEIEKEYGENYRKFLRYFVGGFNPYVRQIHEKNKPNRLELTKDGLKFYLEMKKNNEDRIHNRISVRGTLAVVMLTLASIFYTTLPPSEELFNKIIFWVTFGLLLLLGGWLGIKAIMDLQIEDRG